MSLTPYPTLRLKLSSTPPLKCRVQPIFPAGVQAAAGLSLTQSGAIYKFGLAFGTLNTLSAVLDPTASVLPFYDPVIGTHNTITYANLASQISGTLAQPLTANNDTNVTLTLGGTPATSLLKSVSLTVGWTGTLAAGRLNANVVQGVTNDTNITGSISAQNLTLGWTGTLSAGRLNANVVQGVTNDTNITGSISAQNLTLGWTGTLSATRGGTGIGSFAQGTVLNASAANTWAATATPTLGVAGTTVGSLAFANATSGTVTLQPVTGALGTSVLSLPAVTDTLVGLAATQTLTNKTISGGTFSGTIAGTPTFSGANFISPSNIAQIAAFSLLGNTGGSPANIGAFTIGSLTQKASPASTDLVLIQDQGASGALKYATVSSISSAGSVSSIGGQTGAITVGVGLAVSSSQYKNTGSGANLIVDPSYLRGHISNLTLSNDGTSPNTVIDIAVGVCCSDDQTTMMKLSTASFTKNCNAAWAVGSGNGALDTGSTLAASTWYHVYIIARADTGVVDALVSTSASSPTLPTNYTVKRRIGSFKTDGSSHIIPFTQNGDEFVWKTFIADVSNAATNNSNANTTMTIPTGVNVWWQGTVWGAYSTVASNICVYPPDAGSHAINSPIGWIPVTTGSSNASPGVYATIRSNTSGQIGVATGVAGSNYYIVTMGWIDRRGKDA